MKHFNITVSGKVQGVFYRQSTMEFSGRSRISGFVRNEPDGSVYIEAEGAVEQLNKLVEWCKRGPTRAVVSDVKVSEGEIKNYSAFEIRR